MTARLPGPGANWQTTRWRRIVSATVPVAVGVLLAYAWTAAGGHVQSHRHTTAAVIGEPAAGGSPPAADGNGASREPFATHRLHTASPAATQWVQPNEPSVRHTVMRPWRRHARLQQRIRSAHGHRQAPRQQHQKNHQRRQYHLRPHLRARKPAGQSAERPARLPVKKAAGPQAKEAAGLPAGQSARTSRPRGTMGPGPRGTMSPGPRELMSSGPRGTMSAGSRGMMSPDPHGTISGRSGVPPAPSRIRSTRLHIGT